ncbi:P-loop containing nucleoside triphosphate hydrolase protein [Irpex rosettiformis]|uniref:P-loop containing nucleoside triphosphate hydrolase protein n=1 Tax=Irpex rosettiformis TaxID=378272 RepID=A0ACB8TZH3_9APHY|nr:P-loop containing nucleoside triphosphate hydrolase protein [Irpex rosettiformis]
MSLSLDNGSSYAKRRLTHISLINQLRAIGAQADLDLPRVVVIGNQSAGKSSLVEAISGITVPRDAGTCTRCPIECRMSLGPQWTCQISIRWEFGSDGSTDNNIREVPFGSHIHKKDEVEAMLRRAQAAVLNPGQDAQNYLSLSAKQLKHLGQSQLQFSRNTICIDLSGPDMTDLAFVDLPGIIQNAQPEVVRLVEQLVASHIKGNSVILVTLPMSDDIENQKALQLAKEADPFGLRTVGVLTKPDTIPPGATKSRELWLEVIEGRRFPLKLGYFCTRQPDEDERAAHITQEDARAAESDFFENTAPWSRSTHRHRFGTQNLVANISAHLVKIIDESLPLLTDETNRQLSLCKTRLAAIPPVTSEPFSFVLELVQRFCANMRAYVKGDAEAAALVQKNSAVYQDMKIKIRSTAPVFIPYTAGHTSILPGTSVFAELQRLEDGENAKVITSFQKQITIGQIQAKIKSALTRELPNNVPYVVKLLLIKEFQSDWHDIVQRAGEQVFEGLKNHTTSLVLEGFGQYTHLRPLVENAVQALLEDKRDSMTAQISKLIKYESTAYTQNDHYLSDGKEKFLAQYKALRMKNLKKTQPAAAVASIGTPVTPTSPAAPARPLFSPSPELRVADYQQGAVPRQTATTAPGAKNLIGAPLNALPFKFSDASPSGGVPTQSPDHKPPFSFSPESTSSRSAPALLTDDARTEELKNVIEGLKRLGYAGVRPEDLQKLSPSDEYEEELALMAEVRAYFKVAYKRIIDYVPLAIDHELLYAFTDDLQFHLLSALGINGTEAVAKCAGYLAEDPDIVAEREELLSRKMRLLGVQAELLKVNMLVKG